MPQGFVITKWTNDQGMLVELKYPEEIEVDLDDMMRVFYAHIVGAGAGGDVLVRLEKAHSNVSSHFTGMDSRVPYLVNLMLELGEDPDMFGDAIIKEINENILKYLNQLGTDINKNFDVLKTLKSYLKSALFLLERLKNMTKEQRLAQIYSSKKSRTILEIMQNRSYSRRELQNILEDKLGTFVSNIEYTLDPFIKTNLLKQDWIEGFSDIFLFLISDFTVFRKPAENIIESTKKDVPSSDLAKKYNDEVKKFFANYQPTLVDNIRIALDLMNPDKYDFIVLLRERAYPLNKLPKSSADSFLDTNTLLKALEEDNIIKIFRDKKETDWVFLFTDVAVEKFYPEYMLENIRTKSLKKEVAIRHLELLEEAYQ
ncbi:MAG: hypothetical protein EU539_12335 [Promethearchaeota archaeon]|nr:MAG: hypothetical protein EU539_12335 [Candidatus Lokiarchaeota archaeon]